MKPSRRCLCIVSRDPLQCSELVLSLQASLEPDDEVEIVMDRRRERDLFETESHERDRSPVERRRNADVDLEVRTKGFALVPGAALSPRAADEPDAEDRARFENILSFKRRREPRPGRALGAASAVMLALILMPPLSAPPDRIPVEVPTAEVARPEPSEPPSRRPSKPSEARAAAARAPRAPRPQSRHGAIDAYAARVEETSGRVFAKARGLLERARSEVIGAMPMLSGPELPGDAAPITRRSADSP
jgi:hypothetical protein